MSFDPLSAAFSLGKVALEKIWPDPSKRAEELRKLEELRDKGDARELDAHVKLLIAQMEINKEEAKSKSLFVAGWRPACGWAGCFSVTYAGLIYPLLTWVWAFTGMEGTPPPFVEAGLLGTIITGMLGISVTRSYDKTQGTNTDSLGKQ